MPLRTPAEAVAFALAQQRWEHAMCLNFVWRCYDVAGNESSALAAQGYPPPIARAIDGWKGSPLKHADRSPAIGAPVYYTAASSGSTAGDGHVAIYVGNGMIRSTDAGGYGVNATVPLDWPERAWGRRLLGWTGDILGHPLELTTPASTPIGDGFDMASLADLQNIIRTELAASEARVKDGIRRDGRARLYKHAETGDYVAIDWDVEPDAPSRILYAHGGINQVRRWFDPYQVVGDSPEQAKVVAGTDWDTLMRLAKGTDSAFSEIFPEAGAPAGS